MKITTIKNRVKEIEQETGHKIKVSAETINGIIYVRCYVDGEFIGSFAIDSFYDMLIDYKYKTQAV